ncbi:uncharacterized protein LOC124913216 [Impatiens glandulifera]|uniref:uncharacterized protein LOC124913216 n=1 Tax=Impatiens glandulifera TaxID=253017 RepID=UPI001FB0AFFC|nr:uncharacterized protein LOC124913216 [Impatiens glandulifera]
MELGINEVHFLEKFEMPKSTQEKYKATNFPIILLKIGTWEKLLRYEGELKAKCYYSTKKIAWEILENNLKSKMEIHFSDIDAMRATMIENQPGTIELLLNKSPLFFRERDPVPMRKTTWEESFDFTQGQASIFRIHHVTFPPGTLDKHYETLLQSDSRLMDISKNVFPVIEFPYFQPNNSNTSNIQFGMGILPQSVPSLEMSDPLPQMLAPQYDPLPQMFPPQYDQTNYNLHSMHSNSIQMHDHSNSIQIHDSSLQNPGMHYQQSSTVNNFGDTIETYGAPNTLPMSDQIPLMSNVMPSIQEENVQFNGAVNNNNEILRNIEQHLFSDESPMVDFSDNSLPHNQVSHNQDSYVNNTFDDDHIPHECFNH